MKSGHRRETIRKQHRTSSPSGSPRVIGDGQNDQGIRIISQWHGDAVLGLLGH